MEPTTPTASDSGQANVSFALRYGWLCGLGHDLRRAPLRYGPYNAPSSAPLESLSAVTYALSSTNSSGIPIVTCPYNTPTRRTLVLAIRQTEALGQIEAVGIFLGTCIRSGLSLQQANTVYGTVDADGQVIRRICQLNMYNQPTISRNFDPGHTECSHSDVRPGRSMKNLTKDKVDRVVLEELLGPREHPTFRSPNSG